MRVVKLRVELRGTAEHFDRCFELSEAYQRGAPVEVSRDETGVGSECLLETADGRPVVPLGCDCDTQVVRDRRISRREGQGRPIGALGLRQPPRLKMGQGVSDDCAKFVRSVGRHGQAPANATNMLYRNWKKF